MNGSGNKPLHILVINDDGPPSHRASPYVLDFVRALQDRGHLVSVCLPDVNKSWIGKALLVGKSVQPTYYYPPPRSGSAEKSDSDADNVSHIEAGEHSSSPPEDDDREVWTLINSTPAACAQLGLFHLFTDRPKIDLVVSGPNYGRNTTSVFALSSGTLGGAMEAAGLGQRGIALSFAFIDRGTHDGEAIAATSRMSVKVIEHLAHHWDPDTHVYSVNIPLQRSAENLKVVRTYMLQNQWKTSCFTAIDVPEGDSLSPDEAEERIRSGEEDVEQGKRPGDVDAQSKSKAARKQYIWTPRFQDVHETVRNSAEGNDGYAVNHNQISVTALKANFMHTDGLNLGEIKL